LVGSAFVVGRRRGELNAFEGLRIVQELREDA
jgi:hypothetical protein